MRKTSLLFAIASVLAITGCATPVPDPYENTLRVIPSGADSDEAEAQLKQYDTHTSYSRIQEEEKPYIRYIMNKYGVIAHETTPPNETPANINLDSLAEHSKNTILAVERWKEAEEIRRYNESLPPPPKEYDPNTYTLPVGFGQNDAYWSAPQQQQYEQQQVVKPQEQASNGAQTGSAEVNNEVAKTPVVLAPQSEQFTNPDRFNNSSASENARPSNTANLAETPTYAIDDDDEYFDEDAEIMRQILLQKQILGN